MTFNFFIKDFLTQITKRHTSLNHNVGIGATQLVNKQRSTKEKIQNVAFLLRQLEWLESTGFQKMGISKPSTMGVAF